MTHKQLIVPLMVAALVAAGCGGDDDAVSGDGDGGVTIESDATGIITDDDPADGDTGDEPVDDGPADDEPRKDGAQDDGAQDDGAQDDGAQDGGDQEGGDQGDAGGATTGSVGSLVLDGEAIALDRSQCVLEEQEVADQTIEYTAQGMGSTAGGEEVLVDVTRFGEDAAIPGDTLSITVGDPFDPESTIYSLIPTPEEGPDRVNRDGSTVTGEGLALIGDEGTDITVSLRIDC